MKKVLLLLPLLSACAPAMTSTTTTPAATAADSLGPFRVGQQWSVSSQSKTDSKITPSTVFFVQNVFLPRNTVIGVAPGGTDKTPIQIEYSPADTFFLLADITPLMSGATNIRTCVLSTMPDATGNFSGAAFHFNPSQVKTNPEAFRPEYLKTHPGTDEQAVTVAFLQAAAAEDTAPCTLRPLR